METALVVPASPLVVPDSPPPLPTKRVRVSTEEYRALRPLVEAIEYAQDNAIIFLDALPMVRIAAEHGERVAAELVLDFKKTRLERVKSAAEEFIAALGELPLQEAFEDETLCITLEQRAEDDALSPEAGE